MPGATTGGWDAGDGGPGRHQANNTWSNDLPGFVNLFAGKSLAEVARDKGYCVAAMAAAYRADVRTLERHCAATFGLCPERAVHIIRMEDAARALRENVKNLKQIAADAGYRDPSTFGRAFKKYWGVTPMQYQGLYVS